MSSNNVAQDYDAAEERARQICNTAVNCCERIEAMVTELSKMSMFLDRLAALYLGELPPAMFSIDAAGTPSVNVIVARARAKRRNAKRRNLDDVRNLTTLLPVVGQDVGMFADHLALIGDRLRALARAVMAEQARTQSLAAIELYAR